MKTCVEFKKGFTLLEVLISLAIISGALITIIYTVNYHLSLISRHETVTIATLLGREKLFDITLQERNKTGRFPVPFQNFSYKIEILDTPFENIKLVKLDVIREEEKIRLLKFAK